MKKYLTWGVIILFIFQIFMNVTFYYGDSDNDLLGGFMDSIQMILLQLKFYRCMTIMTISFTFLIV
jgi:hypothetical protein